MTCTVAEFSFHISCEFYQHSNATMADTVNSAMSTLTALTEMPEYDLNFSLHRLLFTIKVKIIALKVCVRYIFTYHMKNTREKDRGEGKILALEWSSSL